MPRGCGRRGRSGCVGRGAGGGRGEGDPAPKGSPTGGPANPANADMATVLATMHAMQAELNALRQVALSGAGGVANGPVPAAGGLATGGAVPAGGVPVVDPVIIQPAVDPQRPLGLREWLGLSLEQFAGTSAPIQAADWLGTMVDKLEAFLIPQQDWVRFATQLLKGEAAVWWRGVQSSRFASSGPASWHEFVRQFERRFYPAAFMDKMRFQLERCYQGRKTVSQYEVAFNQVVRFVPHVAYDEVEKARVFRQGLRAEIRHVLGALPLVDFRSVVEQALGVEMQDDYTDDIRGGQKGNKGHSSGPIQKKDKSHRHQPYSSSSSQAHGSEGGLVQYRPIAKPGMGLVCFRCGDAHRREDCRWSGQCSICRKGHKDVVCRKNSKSKISWEPVSSSSSQRGFAHMMSDSSFVQQYFPAPPAQQFLPAPPVVLMAGPSIAPAPGGAYWFPRAPTPSAPSVPWTSTPTGFSGPSTSGGVQGAYAMPSSDGRDHGVVVTAD